MNRIESKFKELKENNKKAFVAYICAGDPSLDSTEKIIHTLEESGVDIIELGIPYSDPLADGPVIQAAALRSLGAGFKISNFFEKVKQIRQNTSIPLAVMVYYSSIFGFGKEKFIAKCEESGIDGLIIPDLPYEEYSEISEILSKTDLCLIPLIAVTSKERIPKLVESAKGFIYCVSSLGVTGERASFHNAVNEFLQEVKRHTKVPICVGFGISKKSDVDRFNQYADGVIVGSAIVRKIFESDNNDGEIKEFISQLM